MCRDNTSWRLVGGLFVVVEGVKAGMLLGENCKDSIARSMRKSHVVLKPTYFYVNGLLWNPVNERKKCLINNVSCLCV